MLNIRLLEQQDWDDAWLIIELVFRAGETYAFSPDISKDEAYQIWVTTPTATYVVVDADDRVVGTYYLKPNQPALGAHICNCGYIVAASARGQGVASEMCRHSQREALKLGFRAMQYNLVVSSNEGAIRLWQRHGFEIVGTLPEAFQHPQLGLVDAHVMYKILQPQLARPNLQS